MKKKLADLVAFLGNCYFRFKAVAYLPFNGDWYGLGNRLKGIMNFYQLGYRKFILVWNTKSWVTDSFENLFELEGCQIAEYTSGSWLYRFYSIMFRRFFPLKVVTEETPFWSFILPTTLHKEEFRHRWSFSEKETYSIDFRFNDIPNDICEFYRPFFLALKPSVKVQERIDSVKLPNHVVGVQIRNTGICSDKKDVCSLETIFAAMEKESPITVFFISAMNSEISAVFKKRFGQRIVELPEKVYTSMVDAVADMYLLGRCSKMIASPGSTFSEVAWWWGGAQIPVVHLKAEFNQANF